METTLAATDAVMEAKKATVTTVKMAVIMVFSWGWVVGMDEL
jgi:hypothetical protein